MKKTLTLIAALILGVSTLGFAEQYPMLEDVRMVYVTIDHAGVEPDAPPIDWTSLNLQIMKKLNSAGIRTAPISGGRAHPVDMPELRITVIMLSMPETEQFVFHIETSLHRMVSVAEKSDVQFSAPVWTSSVTMQSTPVDGVNDAITQAAMRQVELFINAHHIAVIKPTDASDTNTPKKLTASGLAPLPVTTAKAAAATPQIYLASKNSKVFHFVKCTSANTISPENVVSFATKDAAIGSGRKPCKKCNP